MEIIKKLTFARIKRKKLPSKGRRQHFYDRVFFDSADSVHHVVEPIAVEMNVAFLGRGMAGSVIRNMIYDLYLLDEKIRDEIPL